MKIGVIGDDFTGSSDVANTLAQAGARTVLYAGIPEAAPSTQVDAAVVALKTRSVPSNEAVGQSVAVCRWLVANGARQILFKYCSTFDSTPQGNIGPVAAALLAELDTPIALVCPAFPGAGRTVYQGHLFVHDRLLNESGMERHPVTPMTDPDIRRWLGRQTGLRIGLMPLAQVRSDPAAALERGAAEGVRLIVTDAVEDADLRALGRAVAGHRLVTGASGIAMGLPANFGLTPQAPAAFPAVAGPGLVLAGSCSPTTLRQVAAYGYGRPVLRLGPEDATDPDPDAGVQRALAFLETHSAAAPMVASSEQPDAVAAAQRLYGVARLAAGYETLFGRLAALAVERGFRRIVAAGGETAGAVAGALGRTAFEIGPEIAPGVPALSTVDEPRLALALKSGNFGGDDFFERALRALSARR